MQYRHRKNGAKSGSDLAFFQTSIPTAGFGPEAKVLFHDGSKDYFVLIVVLAFTAACSSSDEESRITSGLDATFDTLVTASNAFIMTHLGFTDVAVYTASLQEWAADPTNPLETAPDPDTAGEKAR